MSYPEYQDERNPLTAADIVVDRMTAAEVADALTRPELAAFIFMLQIAAASGRKVARANPQTQAGFTLMVTLGVLENKARADEILS